MSSQVQAAWKNTRSGAGGHTQGTLLCLWLRDLVITQSHWIDLGPWSQAYCCLTAATAVHEMRDNAQSAATDALGSKGAQQATVVPKNVPVTRVTLLPHTLLPRRYLIKLPTTISTLRNGVLTAEQLVCHNSRAHCIPRPPQQGKKLARHRPWESNPRRGPHTGCQRGGAGGERLR